MTQDPETWIYIVDIHFPEYHRPTRDAILDFMERNNVAGVILGGDQHSNDCLSHWNEKKPLYKTRRAFTRETDGFEKEWLTPLEDRLKPGAQKIWVTGNHERMAEQDFAETHPELEDLLNRPKIYRLKERGWTIISLGKRFKHGKLNFLHGEWLSKPGTGGSAFPAKRLVETLGANALCGHTHAPQSYARISPVDETDRHMGYISPIAGLCNPAYTQNRPKSWINGFTLVEFHPESGNFNCYPVVVTGGRFSYGGRMYGKK